jgi:anaerobic magnesium-protoporphyrin IX monomethyl ester cyclase
MKILLAKPPSNMHFTLPPIGLGYIAAYLKSKIKDVDIFFLDCLRENYGHKEFLESVIKINPDLVGLTAFTMEIESAIKCCEVTKSYNKQIVTVIGGPHATCEPEEVLSNSHVDFIFQGESEAAFCEFIQNLKNKKDFHRISNIGYKEDGQVMLNEVKSNDDLDELPFPDYELMKFERYPKTYKMKYYPSGPLIASRGCPFLCAFCSAGKISGKRFRARSPKNIINEIKFFKERYKIKEFEIWDDNFTLDRERTEEFCDLLMEGDVNLPWWCPNGLRAETLDEELIKKMKKAGLYSIAIGIESGSERIQRDMKKNLDFDKVKEIVRLGNKYRIRMEGFFILGYPTETKEDILKTIKLLKELPLKRASILLFQPLVGSEIYNSLKSEGKLKGIDARNVEYSKPSVLPEGFKSMNELKRLQQKTILGFYLRPKIFLDFVKVNLTIDQIKELLKMVKKYIFNE